MTPFKFNLKELALTSLPSPVIWATIVDDPGIGYRILLEMKE